MIPVWAQPAKMADAWSARMLATSWQVTVLVAAVLVVTLLARKASARFRYALWCLVLVKLCLPPSLSFFTGIGRWLPDEPVATRPTRAIIDPNEATPTTAVPPVSTSAQTTSPPAAGAASLTRAPAHVPWRLVFFSVWLGGVVGTAALVARRHASVRRCLRNAARVSDARVLSAFEEARAAVGVRRDVSLVVAEGLPSPIVVGVLRPCVALPSEVMQRLPASQVKPILLHELAHLRRGDLWVSWLMAALQALYWFHPAVWLAMWQLRRERELVVDDMVLTHLNYERELYGESLVAVLREAARRGVRTSLSVGIIEAGGDSAGRLRRILDVDRRIPARLGWVSLGLIVALGLVLIPQARRTRAQEAGAEAETTPVTVNMSGRVIGLDDQPVPGASVLVHYVTPAREVATKQVVSAEDGSFEVTFEILDRAHWVSVEARKPGLGLGWVSPAADELTVVMKRAVACEGTVTDPAGQPIAGAMVSVRSLARPPQVFGNITRREVLSYGNDPLLTVATDAQGRFEFVDLPQGESVLLSAEGVGLEHVWLPDDVPTDSRDVEIVLHKEAVITGRVVHNGQPLANVTVTAWPRGLGAPQRASTDERGQYRIGHLGPGAWGILVDPPDGLLGPAIDSIALQAGQVAANQDVALTPGGLLRGTVVWADTGEPAERAEVFAQGPSRPEWCDLAESTSVGEDGTFELRVAPGRNTVHCAPPTELLFTDPTVQVTPRRRDIDVSEGQTIAGIAFTVTRKVQPVVRGRVVDAEGQPVAGVRVGSTHDTGVFGSTLDEQFTAVSNADGQFELSIRRPEEHDGWPVLAMDRERGLAGMARLPANRVPEEPVELKVEPGGYVTGRIVDTDGRPAKGVPVHVAVFPRGQGIGYGMNAGETDANGAFRVGPFHPKPSIEVGAGGPYSDRMVGGARQMVQVTAKGDVELEPIVVNAAGRSIRGMVIDQDQRPIRGAIVCASGVDETVRTDGEGRFEVKGLASRGKLWVAAMHPTRALFAAENLDPDWEYEPGLVLRKPGSAEGRLVDQDGRPLAGMKLRGYPEFPVTSEQGGSYRLTEWQQTLQERLGHRGWFLQPVTDQNGRWHADGLLRGAQYRLIVELADGREARESYTFTVAEEGVTDAGELAVAVK
jgi:beta-lactamase regulating signal transducer with metallopeptidase domain/protocatechuate 3,4-dioxygenase beta subunit